MQMLKQFNAKDIDVIMEIWKDGNLQFQSFIDTDYWMKKYVDVRKEFLKDKIYVYTEATNIKAFVVINPNGEITNIYVTPEIQREGIGENLIQKLKSENTTLLANVYEKNYNAMLFFKAMGFKKISEGTNEINNEKYFTLQWSKGEAINTTLIYFNNSIKKDLIEKYDKLNKLHFFNVRTTEKESKDAFDINIEPYIEKQNNEIIIKNYIEVRNMFNSMMKDENIVIYFDCNELHEYLFNLIKNIVKIKNVKLNIVMHNPLSVDGTKKQKIYEIIKQEFKDYNFIDVDYEVISKDLNISFKDAFENRDEALLKTIIMDSGT